MGMGKRVYARDLIPNHNYIDGYNEIFRVINTNQSGNIVTVSFQKEDNFGQQLCMEFEQFGQIEFKFGRNESMG